MRWWYQKSAIFKTAFFIFTIVFRNISPHYYFSSFRHDQRDQIWRNFTTLAILGGRIQFWAKFRTYLGKIGQSLIVVNGQNGKHKLAIWSHWLTTDLLLARCKINIRFELFELALLTQMKWLYSSKIMLFHLLNTLLMLNYFYCVVLGIVNFTISMNLTLETTTSVNRFATD